MSYWRFVLFFILIIINTSSFVVAQKREYADSTQQKSLTQQRDITDVFRKSNSIAFYQKTDSVFKQSLGPFNSLFLYPGYALVTSFQAVFTGNISFYTDTLRRRKISSLLVNSLYTANKQWIEIANSNIWTKHNRFNLLGDWRFYRFPSYTFGLGSNTSLTKSSKIDYSYVRLYEVAMTKIARNIYAGLGYNLDYHYNITEVQNDSITGINGMDENGFKTKTFSSGITLNMQYDNRLNANNPQRGSYANIQFRDNLKVTGSDNNWTSLVIDLRHYIPFPKHSGNIIAIWSYEWLTLTGIPPYLDLPCTGWDTYNNTGRGYIEGRFRGTNLIYLETEYRFHITHNGLLGGVVFINSSTLSQPDTQQFGKINLGSGFGLRVKINKQSNTNFVIDFGFGTEGSRGFSFNLNEVF